MCSCRKWTAMSLSINYVLMSRSAGTPVVFHTATYDQGEARLLAEQCGVLHVLTKPTDAEQLMRVVSTVLNEQHSDLVTPLLSDDFDQQHLRLVSNRLLRSTHD